MSRDQGLKPIETHYKGYRFRSRLEARYAVFFDALGIPWEYEAQGYDLGAAGPYLPDFHLPSISLIFVTTLAALTRGRDQGLIAPEEEPCDLSPEYPGYCLQRLDRCLPVHFEVKPTPEDAEQDLGKFGALAVQSRCPTVVAVGDPYLQRLICVMEPGAASPSSIVNVVERVPVLLVAGSGATEDVFLAVFQDVLHQEVYEACSAARSARFEHGECGAPTAPQR